MDSAARYHRHRFPIDIVSRCVWLYFRYSLSYRDARAAERCIRKILKAEGALPRRVVTDPLGSYGVAMKKLMPGIDHIKNKGANNRAENSHQPTRQRERRRSRFRSADSAQRFLSRFSFINNHFRNYRHTLSAPNHRLVMAKCFAEWHQICGSVL